MLEKRSLRPVRCANCSMVYANPVSEDLAAGTFYDRLADFYLSREKLQSDYASVRYERELRLFRTYCPGGDVLDVGCSTGAFLFQLKNRWPDEYRIAGTDVVSRALEYAAGRGVEVLRGSFLEHDFGARRFDAVTFWAVLEHVAEPKQFLRRAAEVMQPGAWAFLLVPNFNSLAVRLLGAKYRYLMPDHLNYFTAATLRKLTMTESAFEFMDLRSIHFNPIVIWQDFRRGGGPVAEAERATLLHRTTALKQAPLLKPLKMFYSGVEYCLGRMGLADNLVAVLRRR